VFAGRLVPENIDLRNRGVHRSHFEFFYEYLQFTAPPFSLHQYRAIGHILSLSGESQADSRTVTEVPVADSLDQPPNSQMNGLLIHNNSLARVMAFSAASRGSSIWMISSPSFQAEIDITGLWA